MSDVRPMPEVEVRTAGEVRDATSVSVSRQIPALGPGHAGVPGGLLAATAEAVMPEPGDVTGRRKLSPWRREGTFPPVDGDTCQITVDDQPRFAGWVEDVDGSAHTSLTVSMVDVVDRLHRPLSLDPLANTMPHSLNTVTGVGRVDAIGLRAEWYVYQAMRAAGFHPVQRPHAAARRHVPMAGSLIASDGTIPQADPTANNDLAWTPAPWGMAARGVNAAWPTGALTSGDSEYIVHVTGPEVATIPLQVNFQLTSGTGSRRLLYVSFPTAGQIRLEYQHISSSETATVPREDTRPVRVTQTGTAWAVYYGDDLVLSGSGQETYSMNRVSVVSPAGCQVAAGPLYAGTAGQTVDTEHVPDATIRVGSLLTGPPLAAGPYIESRNALDLLHDVAAAQGAAVWLTPAGHLHYAHLDVLEAQPPTATITADADLLDMSWRLSVRDVRRRVYVSCRHPEVQVSAEDDIVLYEGSRETFRRLDASRTAWATPEADVEWLTHAAEHPNRWFTSNQGDPATSIRDRTHEKGTWWGALVIIGTGEDAFAPYMGSASFQAWRVTSQALRYAVSVGVDPGEGDAVAFRIPRNYFPEPEWEDMAHWNGAGLPMFRGMGKVLWSTTRYTATMTGPQAAADYEHDSGPWTQGRCQQLANWLGARMTQPRPLIEELPIVWRDDLDLGQVVSVVEDEVYGVELTCLVVGIREAHTPEGGARMWVTLRVLDHEVIDEGRFGEGLFGDGPFGGTP